MSAVATGLTLESLTAAEMHKQQDELQDVYRDAYADKIDSPFFTEDRHWERLTAYAQRETFGMVLARQDGLAVGYALGCGLPVGSHWWDGLLAPVDPELILEDGTRTFALNYMMVRQALRRQGIARALHDALVLNRPEKRATLTVLPANVAARSAYLSWGWYDVGMLRPSFDDAPTYQAMILDLQHG